MPEREAGSEALRAGAPLTVGRVTLLPVERVVVRSFRIGEAHAWFSAIKEPYAVVVRDGSGTRAVATGDTEVSLERLRERVPGLDDALGSGR